ncbi:NlpC/P60 family protein [Peribacillus saganii]|uniref:NlpC/P60 family protein n=1 Tax=Peribacillus saganii TaxID=2303992 RepID=A0A372LM95_9BACI|nr:C40 family peptidase [Peribacillus saganii]RFU67925.1 NlpC/P60 family protein [Peribacillus saganii]
MKRIVVAALLSLSILFSLVAPFDTAEASTKDIVAEGMKYIGTKYKFGGTTPSGFDCSGFLGYTYKKATGKTLPRTAASIFTKGKAVAKADLLEGDLVFFTTYKKGASHAGIYIGNNKFIHASSSKGVRIDSLNSSYWKNKYIGSKRI